MTSNSDNMQNLVIGHSARGKPLIVRFIGQKESYLRIFIISGQHGDERYSQKAVDELINHFRSKSNYSFYAAVLTDANPDGFENNTRENSKSIDLNRDHVLLKSNETRAIHSFVRGWMPKIIIDVHNYPSRRKHLLKKHLVLSHDIFVDIPTNPAILQKLDDEKTNEFFTTLKSDLHQKGISCERYTIFQKSGKIRHSTIDIKDARNSLALRYDVFCIILEGKEPLKKEGIEGENRTIHALYHALCRIIDWLENNSKEFDESPHISKKGELVPIRARYRDSKDVLRIEVEDSKTHKINEVNLRKYSHDIEITKFVEMPECYVIPKSLVTVLEILKNHEFSYNMENNEEKQVEMYYLEYSPISNRIKKKTKTLSLSKYVTVPTAQVGGRFLALLLEPSSKFGLHRFPETKLSFSENLKYPIYRI